MVRRLVRAIGLTTLAGLVLWAVIAIVAWRVDDATLDLPAVLLLFAQLVTVPLGLGLVGGEGPPLAEALHRAAWIGIRVGMVAAIATLAVPRGEWSAAVAALYLVPALAIGAGAAVRAMSRDLRRPPELARLAAAGFLVVGALFFVLHRQGVSVAGQPEHIVQLTAVHFHFTGYGLMLMAGALASRSPRVGAAGVWVLLAGMLVTPIGFLTDPGVRGIGALLVVAALLVIAVGTVGVLSRVGPGTARRLLFVSATFAWIVGGMAAVYGVTEALGPPAIPLIVMASLHGVFAALGVVFCGLLGWRLTTFRG